jgi:hypothetical protein
MRLFFALLKPNHIQMSSRLQVWQMAENIYDDNDDKAP